MKRKIFYGLKLAIALALCICVIETTRRAFPPVEVKVVHYIWTEKGLQQIAEGHIPPNNLFERGPKG